MSEYLPVAAIIETVTTTINPDGTVNCAAMGVEWGEEIIVIKSCSSDAFNVGFPCALRAASYPLKARSRTARIFSGWVMPLGSLK